MTDMYPVLRDIFTRSVLVLAIAAVALTGCKTALAPHQSAQGYGAATTITDTDGNRVEITPPTPAEEALAGWVKLGGFAALAGIACLLPWGGGPHVRTGLMMLVSGAGMAALGKWLGDMTLSVPAWFLPALLALVAAGMLYGWHVRNAQQEDGNG